MPMAAETENASFVTVNTVISRPPLCPELRLRLLRENAPLKHSAAVRRGEPDLFAWNGPRPYWAFAWASGQAMARFILDRPQLVQGKHVLDFGAGCGIAAIGAARAGAASVTAADIDPIALQAIDLNADLNDVAVTAKQENILERKQQNWNVLLAADVFYCRPDSDVQCLLNWACRDRLILIADPPQRGFPKQYLKELARYTVRTFPDLEHPCLQEASVYSLPATTTTITTASAASSP